MTTPRVYNKAKDIIPQGAVYVGRPSKWGNPFRMNDPLLPRGLSLLGKRKAVISEYAQYLEKHPELVEAAKKELKGKDLVCWCSPLPCHADILLKVSNEP